MVHLPEDEGAHEDAGDSRIRPGVSIQLMRGKLAVALNIHHLHGQLRICKYRYLMVRLIQTTTRAVAFSTCSLCNVSLKTSLKLP